MFAVSRCPERLIRCFLIASCFLLPAFKGRAQEGTLEFENRYLSRSRYSVALQLGQDSLRIFYRKPLRLSPDLEADTFYRRTFALLQEKLSAKPETIDVAEALGLVRAVDSLRDQYTTFARDTIALAASDSFAAKVRAYLLRQDRQCDGITFDGFDVHVTLTDSSGTRRLKFHSPHRSSCYPLLGDIMALSFEYYRALRTRIDFSTMETFGY